MDADLIVAGLFIGGLIYMSTSKPKAGTWVRSNSGIILSDAAALFLNELAPKLAFGITVTSGTRTYESQTRAMLGMTEKQMYIDYNDDLVDELLSLPRTVADWLPIVTEAYESGILSKSGHISGMAIDLRTRDLTESQIGQLQVAVKSLGASYLREYGPPHLHVNIPSSYADRFGESEND